MSKVAQDSVISIEQMRKSAEESAANSQRIAGAAEQMRSQATRQRQITGNLRHVIDGSSLDENPSTTYHNQSGSTTATATTAKTAASNPANKNIDAHFSDY